MYHSLVMLAGMLLLFNSKLLLNPVFFILIPPVFIWIYRKKQFYLQAIAIFIFAYSWALGFALIDQTNQLPDSLVNQSVVVSACISELDTRSQNYQRIRLEVIRAHLNRSPIEFKASVSLSNYTPLLKPITSGWCGEFLVRLKPVHGRLNKIGFDYEAWAYVNNIKAVGTFKQSVRLFRGTSLVNRYRQFKSRLTSDLTENLDHSDSMPLIVSLGLGNKNLINQQSWSVLRHTGTSHLLAISGLHIGLVFWMVSCMGSLLWRVCGSFSLILPAQKFGWICGLISSGGYLILTGLPLSGCRAWMMLACFVLAWMFNKRSDIRRTFSIALIVILLIWPRSVLSIGFWFSFIAVGLIITQIVHEKINLDSNEPHKYRVLLNRIIFSLKLQMLLSVALVPLTVISFGEISLISPLANLIAIPLVSFVILPLILVGILSLISGLESLSMVLLSISQSLLSQLLAGLRYLAELDWSWAMPQLGHELCWILLLISAFGFLLCCHWPGRWIVLMAIIPIFLNSSEKLKHGEFKLVVFDVGQGLASWIQTKDHHVLIDTGFGIKNGFNYFDSVIYPTLKSSGVNKLDASIISHGDSDHAGGYQALVDSNLYLENIFQSQQPGDAKTKYCENGLRWEYNGVEFKFLTQHNAKSDNNQSCILKVTSQFGSILLPGDIERESEQSLVKGDYGELESTILLVPHHGSQTSSSVSFLQAVKPVFGIFSAGYLNRYGHPHKKIVQRYLKHDTQLLNTACHGQIVFRVLKHRIRFNALKLESQAFWRHKC